jgi:hypothetical protein
VDELPDLSCKNSTRQHAVDDPLLSCIRCSLLGATAVRPAVSHASPDGISGDRSTVPAVVWVTEGAASHGLIIRLIIQTILLDPSGGDPGLRRSVSLAALRHEAW